MKLNVSEFAKKTGVSIRTLHYYDEIGLLKPDFTDSQTGYRFYGAYALEKMQEILFYRELDFPLKTIKEILSSPDYNKKKALEAQKELLLLKKERLDKIISALECVEEGKKDMNFNVFSNREMNNYKEEVRNRWAKTDAYKEHIIKTAEYSSLEWDDIARNMEEILKGFGELKGAGFAADDNAVLLQVKKLQLFITKTQYTCTKEILSSLGSMYVTDDRFRKNIDKNGIGTAQFISDAIAIYCK